MFAKGNKLALIVLVFLIAIGTRFTSANILYVDDNASGANDGSSWDDAYIFLQDALAAAEAADKPIEICVAQGLYLPDRNSAVPEGTGEREATFKLINGVTLSGGYAGVDTLDPNDRDILFNETILSGDLEGDDPYGNRNSIHVVTGSGTAPSSIIDGFTITGGRAVGDDFDDYSEPEDFGGAMYNYHGNPTIKNCCFVYNSGHVGGAVYNYRCSPKLTDCIFILNTGGRGGGGMHNCRSNPILINCHFLRNLASVMHYGGGGLHNENGSNPTLINCIFEENFTELGSGGAIYSNNSNPVLTNCIFKQNTALREYQGRGGAIYSEKNSQVTATNCLFLGNTASHSGGALYCFDHTYLQIINCTFLGNSAQRGHALACSYHGVYERGDPNHVSEMVVTNCILWDGGDEVWNGDASSIIITFSDINGGWDAMGSHRTGIILGEGNLEEDPLLTPHGHLQAGSPCIDAGDDTAIFTLPAWEDIHGDSRLIDVPNVIGNQAGFYDIIDIGADEFYDFDKDRLPDWWEEQYFLNAIAADPNEDSDRDGLSNLKEYECYGSHPMAQPIYVDSWKGSDAYDGRWPMPRKNGIGPKKTIQAGIDLADNGDTVLVAPGGYQDNGNTNLDFYGRSIILRAASETESTTIYCRGMARAFHFHSGEMANTAVIGISIQNGRADGGGGIRIEGASPRLQNCSVLPNTSVAEIHRLTFSTGYDFSQQRDVFSNEGDFYYRAGNREDMNEGRRGQYQFAADFPDWGQRGLIDLGPIALRDIATIPTEGYVQTNVAAIIGHSYVALAREDEADFCIVFSVLSINNPTVTIEYMYVDRNAWPNYTPPGGGIYCNRGFPILEDCIIYDSTPDGIFMQDAGARIEGTVVLASALWRGTNVILTGNGKIYLGEPSVLDLDDSTIRCDIEGPGTIQVDVESEFTVEEESVINLQGSAKNGSIQCDGLLHLRGSAQLLNSDLNVTRACFEGDTIISNSIIIAEAGVPYGQFFIEDTVRIADNEIHADGDRYMDLNPTAFQGIIENNRIYVTITEGIDNTRGGLLELRAPDFFGRAPPDDTFMIESEYIPDFNDISWTIERLELVKDAKVNLTNRFDFTENGLNEVIYVKDLVLGPGSVLNTSFNRLYYGSIYLDDRATITNVPLLGFSLNNITCDDEDEFSSRVVHNNHGYIRESPYSGFLVQRVEGLFPDPNGMMRMCNLKDLDPNSPFYRKTIYARAKGLFSKSNEGQILITFEYLFESDAPETELVVYLSDVPELQTPRNPNHHIEVGHIRPPRQGRPGSVDSGRFGIFHTYTNRGQLDFIRGTRVELELIGPEGASVLINNWDPQIQCSKDECLNIDGEIGVNSSDLKPILAAFGSSAGLDGDGTGSECVDGILSGDGHVDSHDVIGGEWAIINHELSNLCPETNDRSIPLGPGLSALGSGATSSAGTVYSSFSGISGQGLVILGKTQYEDTKVSQLITEGLYSLGDGSSVTGYTDLGEWPYSSSNIKLVKGLDGELYQVNIEKGICRLDSNGLRECILASGQSYPITAQRRYYGQGGTVYVGLQYQDIEVYGRPVWDAVVTSDHIYAVPVVVVPDGNEPYLAAAKFKRLGGSTLELLTLYDDPIFFDERTRDNPDLSDLHEIEVDSQGNVYVLNTQSLNSSEVLWKYGPEGDILLEPLELTNPKVDTDPNVLAPVGLCISNNTLYLASGRNKDDKSESKVYAFDTTDLSVKGSFTITDMEHVTDMTQDGLGNLWVVGLNVDNEMLDSIKSWSSVTSSFYEPRIASISANQLALSEVTVPSDPIAGDTDLGLPLSIVWVGIN